MEAQRFFQLWYRLRYKYEIHLVDFFILSLGNNSFSIAIFSKSKKHIKGKRTIPFYCAKSISISALTKELILREK
jgi:hypothetical protein